MSVILLRYRSYEEHGLHNEVAAVGGKIELSGGGGGGGVVCVVYWPRGPVSVTSVPPTLRGNGWLVLELLFLLLLLLH